MYLDDYVTWPILKKVLKLVLFKRVLFQFSLFSPFPSDVFSFFSATSLRFSTCCFPIRRLSGEFLYFFTGSFLFISVFCYFLSHSIFLKVWFFFFLGFLCECYLLFELVLGCCSSSLKMNSFLLLLFFF